MDAVINFFDDLFAGRPEVILSFVIFGAVALAVLGLFFVLTQSAARRRLSGRVRATSGGAGTQVFGPARALHSRTGGRPWPSASSSQIPRP